MYFSKLVFFTRVLARLVEIAMKIWRDYRGGVSVNCNSGVYRWGVGVVPPFHYTIGQIKQSSVTALYLKKVK